MPLISALLHFPFSLLHFVKKKVFNQPASTGFLTNQTELFSFAKSSLIKFLHESTLQGKGIPKSEKE